MFPLAQMRCKSPLHLLFSPQLFKLKRYADTEIHQPIYFNPGYGGNLYLSTTGNKAHSYMMLTTQAWNFHE
jgi:hypothetical protein